MIDKKEWLTLNWNAESLAAEVADQVVAWRRYLHQNPELSFQENKTSQYIYETLSSFGNLEISRPTATSVVARLIGAQPGPVLGIRADIDALPIQEENQVPYASSEAGVMHACGHDGHTAMLLGTAKILSNTRNRSRVRFDSFSSMQRSCRQVELRRSSRQALPTAWIPSSVSIWRLTCLWENSVFSMGR